MTSSFADAATMVAALSPDQPVYCVRPHVLRENARRFLSGFPGDVLYAVKCNAEPMFLDALHEGGIRHFDTASMPEVRLIKGRYPEASAYFMHPVKPRGAVAEAENTYGVRHFVVDHPDELNKVLAESTAPESVIVVRLATARGAAVYDLGGKFGCSVMEAAILLNRAAAHGRKVGVTFHVGSQCLVPASYLAALRLVREVLALAPVRLSLLDVGGGFPVPYVGVQPPPLEDYLAAIRQGVAELSLPPDCQLACEPGRALVASGASLVVRVELRRDNTLYINDGVYGSLEDLKIPQTQFPMRLIRPHGPLSTEMAEFGLFGPTCDPADAMPGPYLLPADTREGDYIEIGQAGAYTTALRTDFNGFMPKMFVQVNDPAFLPLSAMENLALPKAA